MHHINSKLQALDDGVWDEGILKKVDDEVENNLKYHVAFAQIKRRHANGIFSED